MHMRMAWRVALVGGCAGGVLFAAGAITACSSSSSSADAGSQFGTSGGPDSGSTHSGGGHTTSTKGGGSSGTSTVGEKTDAACGTKPPSDWCDLNAPMPTTMSSVYCEDFDSNAPLNGIYGYFGVTLSNWVSRDYTSPYCALKTFVGDGGGKPTTGSYSYHAYSFAETGGAMSMAVDIMVPSSQACVGATVARMFASPTDESNNAVMAWLDISAVTGSGSIPTSYAVEVYALAGTRPDGGAGGGTAVSSAAFTVTPSATGWARLALAATSYSVTAGGEASITAVAYWGTAGDAKTQLAHQATPLSAKGSNVSGPATPGAEMDFGIIPDPSGGKPAVSGCEVLIDNAVSNLTATP